MHWSINICVCEEDIMNIKKLVFQTLSNTLILFLLPLSSQFLINDYLLNLMGDD